MSDPLVRERTRVDLPRLVVAGLGVGSVACLLAWVYGLGTFRLWFLLTGLPSLLALAGLGWATRTRGRDGLRLALVAGTVGGLVGTVGYDVFRIPFVLGGLRLFAPIESYGILLLGADGSSSTTDFAGWAYHFCNGIGFGITYAAVALGRRWPWAVLWGVILETATILTPFADAYAIRGKWDLIAIAYAAHLAYGIPLGLTVQRAVRRERERPLVVPASWALGALVVTLVLWHQPFTSDDLDKAGRAVADGPSAVVANGRLHPQWSRVRPGQCVPVRNLDDVAYPLPGGATLGAHAKGQLCVSGRGAHRVKLGASYSGGFVLVDDQLR